MPYPIPDAIWIAHTLAFSKIKNWRTTCGNGTGSRKRNFVQRAAIRGDSLDGGGSRRNGIQHAPVHSAKGRCSSPPYLICPNLPGACIEGVQCGGAKRQWVSPTASIDDENVGVIDVENVIAVGTTVRRSQSFLAPHGAVGSAYDGQPEIRGRDNRILLTDNRGWVQIVRLNQISASAAIAWRSASLCNCNG